MIELAQDNVNSDNKVLTAQTSEAALNGEAQISNAKNTLESNKNTTSFVSVTAISNKDLLISISDRNSQLFGERMISPLRNPSKSAACKKFSKRVIPAQNQEYARRKDTFLHQLYENKVGKNRGEGIDFKQYFSTKGTTPSIQRLHEHVQKMREEFALASVHDFSPVKQVGCNQCIEFGGGESKRSVEKQNYIAKMLYGSVQDSVSSVGENLPSVHRNLQRLGRQTAQKPKDLKNFGLTRNTNLIKSVDPGSSKPQELRKSTNISGRGYAGVFFVETAEDRQKNSFKHHLIEPRSTRNAGQNLSTRLSPLCRNPSTLLKLSVNHPEPAANASVFMPQRPLLKEIAIQNGSSQNSTTTDNNDSSRQQTSIQGAKFNTSWLYTPASRGTEPNSKEGHESKTQIKAEIRLQTHERRRQASLLQPTSCVTSATNKSVILEPTIVQENDDEVQTDEVTGWFVEVKNPENENSRKNPAPFKPSEKLQVSFQPKVSSPQELQMLLQLEQETISDEIEVQPAKVSKPRKDPLAWINQKSSKIPHMLTSEVSKTRDKIKVKNSLFEQIKAVEQAIKDRKRDIKKMETNVNESQNYLAKQRHVTESVMAYFSSSLEPPQIFPTISTSNFDSLQSKSDLKDMMDEKTWMPLNTAAKALNQTSTLLRDSRIHNFYQDKMSSEFENTRLKAVKQADIERVKKSFVEENISILQLENHVLRRKIKNLKEILDKKQEQINLDKNLGSNTTLFHASDSVTNGGFSRKQKAHVNKDLSLNMYFASSKKIISGSTFETNRFEYITMKMSNLNKWRSPGSTLLNFIRTLKSSFNPFQSLTVFILDRYLQHVCFAKLPSDEKKHIKIIEMGGQVIYCFFDEEKHFEAPVCFPNEVKESSFTSNSILIPVRHKGKYLFLLQLVADKEKNVLSNQKQSTNLESQASVAQLSNLSIEETSSGLNLSSVVKKGVTPKKVQAHFTQTDFLVAKIISILLETRLLMFFNSSQKVTQTRLNVAMIKFNQDLMAVTNYKDLVRMIKNDLTRLLDFKDANLMFNDVFKKSLFTFSLNEEEEKLARKQANYFTEKEINVEQRYACLFPYQMGLTGFVFSATAVNSCNDFNKIDLKAIDAIEKSEIKQLKALLKGETYSICDKILGKDVFSLLLKKKISAGFSFNSKIDNFLELDQINNIVFSSVFDEFAGKKIGCGVLQLYNKRTGPIAQADLYRVYQMRKIIGAAITRCEMYALTLNELIGIGLREKMPQRCADMLDVVSEDQSEKVSVHLSMSFGTILRKIDPKAPPLYFTVKKTVPKEEKKETD